MRDLESETRRSAFVFFNASLTSIYILLPKTRIDAINTITLSPKFQLVIPKHIRESMQLKAGTPMQVVQYGDRIEFIPVRPMQAARGMLSGMNTDFDREDDRE